MSSVPVRASEINAVGPCSSATDLPSPQQHAATPTLNNLLRGDSAAAAMYIQQQQGMQQLQIRPPHIPQQLMGPPQGFQSQQASPIPNGSYSSPGSVGAKPKPKTGSRPASRDVLFPPSAGQGGPPPQMPQMQNPAIMGLRMDGQPQSPSGFASSEMSQSHAAAVAAQQQQQQQMQSPQIQQPYPPPPAMYPPGYWPPPQQARYPVQAAPPGHYYHQPAPQQQQPQQQPPQQQQQPHSAFSGYAMPPNRAVMPGGKMTERGSPMEMPRMPNGPSAADWQAKMTARPNNQSQEGVLSPALAAVSTSSGNVPVPSPGGASSAADESLDDSKSLRGGSPASWPHTPAQLSQGQRTPVPPGQPSTPGLSGAKTKDSANITDKLVGPVSVHNPQHVMADRRAFFEKLVLFCERQGEPITQVPQVSKQSIDLHRLYIAVMKRGGFEQVTRDKTWKNVCTEANSEMSESSAAGYQLRRHYQKYLLGLECFETGRSLTEMVAFAEKLKKRRRTDKEHLNQPQQQQFPGSGPPGQAPGAPPGYVAHPGDPNAAAYYYGHQMDPSSMQPRPHGWPQSYPPGAAPPGYPPNMRPAAPMRAPMPQQMGPSLEEQQRYEEQQRQHYYQQQQQAAYAAQQQMPNPAPPPSAASLQVDQCNPQSRAPSADPRTGSATPDSTSRLSADDSHCQTPVSVPSSLAQGPPNPNPNQQPPVGYYAQAQTPQMYGSAGMRPGLGPVSAGMPMKQSTPYPGAYNQAQPSGYPSMHGYPEGYQGMAQQQHHLYQQQMWASQQAASQRYPPGAAPSSTPARVSSSGDMNSMSQAYAQPRRAPYYHIQQQPNAPSPSPGAVSAHRMRYAAPPASSSSPLPQSQQHYQSQSLPQQGQTASRAVSMGGGGAPLGYSHMTPSTSTALPTPQQNTAIPSSNQYPPQSQTQPFPAGSVEATTISQRRRRKLLSKDLVRADVRRLTMALRSGLETETTWALNALNALLYDDMAVPVNLNQAPALLNVTVEHFRAQLAILYPKVFKVGLESRVRTVADESDLWGGLLCRGDSSPAKLSVMPRPTTANNNFTTVSRTGRTVHVENKQLPDHLRRMRPDGWSIEAHDGTLSSEYFESRVPRGMGCGTSTYLACRIADNLDTSSNLKRVKFFVHESDASTSGCCKSDISEVVDYDSVQKSSRVIDVNKSSGSEKENEETCFELRTLRATALCIRDEGRSSVVKRCLALSNILRGFSFLPGNEAKMSRHQGLLFIVGRLLRLFDDEIPICRPKTLRVKMESNQEDAGPVPEPGSLSEASRRLLQRGELLESDDDDTLMLIETANLLREDAFVIIAHLSVQLDLVELDENVSWPIFDGLLHWAVSKVAEAKDPLQPGPVSPRNYALEALCKMSVIEHNVDLLLSTGPWLRIERFIKVLADLLSVNEEIPCREFAIVILNAVCAASEPACYVTAADSSAVGHLVSFLETGDANMHQVVQQHGMQALRDNHEMMGTSVGMLRRAACLMQHMCKVRACSKFFLRHQQRLLQFTMSQLMDSRVGAIIADVLYEVQRTALQPEETKKHNHHPPSPSKPLPSLKQDCESADDETNRTREDSRKRRRHDDSEDEDRAEKSKSVDRGDAKELPKRVVSCPSLKKTTRMENGTVNHVLKNGDEEQRGTALVNGDSNTTTPHCSSPQHMSPPLIGSVAAPLGKNTTAPVPSAVVVPPVENGTSGGSVQAVA